ncbi:hypothetical protein [Frankia sp. Cas3]|uniref:hypothetical protein n=1 Tax=Frankia sp. Cas3 TaxID=3073926 RepID=UPI002AD4C151|nr:hypothetical protein [Frankia sp. Cas3]
MWLFNLAGSLARWLAGSLQLGRWLRRPRRRAVAATAVVAVPVAIAAALTGRAGTPGIILG